MSRAGAIADAVKAGITALAFPGVTGERRKIPALPAGKDPPQIVVSVGEEGDTIYLDFEYHVLVRYPVAVTIVTAGGSLMEDDNTLRDWRESIRKKIDDPATYSAVTGFMRTLSAGRVPFDVSALSKDLNFAVQVFTAEVLEDRT